MKHVSIFFISFLTALSIHAQQNTSVVTITVNGNKNVQISVDAKEYNPNGSNAAGNKTTIALNSVNIGQHTLQVTRTDQNTNRPDRISTTFNLRRGYDMLINLNGNGSLELIETKKTGFSDNRVSMSDADYNKLLNNVRSQRSTSGRRSSIANAFENAGNYFTTSQVVQLLQLVNSENFRLQLAKLSYQTITDRSNFSQVYDLLNSQASEDELQDYVNNYSEDSNLNVAMSDVNFNSLYDNIRQQYPAASQMNSLSNAFSNTNNYFTTYQARQLIQLVTSESNRLQLAKSSYRSITDPVNFNQLYNLFSSQASKDELAAYVNNYNMGSNSNVAMSDANFNSLYNNIRQQYPVASQMNSLSNAFSNTNNYFTTYQARQLIQLVTSESNRLQLAKSSYRSITDPVNFNQLYNLFSSQASKDELAAYVNNYNTGSNNSVAMSDANFNSLYNNIQQQYPVTSQVNSLSNAFNNTNNYFTTYQARQLIQLVTAESNRLQLAKSSYRSITDPVNFSQLYNLFRSQASKDELAAYVNNYNTGSNSNVAMSDANFNNLYRGIQRQFFPGEKMNSLTDAFNNTGNYFTCSQAKQLVQLVSLENNRLQLAKLSYRTIVDRTNFNQLYDLLNQASRNELDAYVKAYKV
jgi:hypothetical protein